MTEQEAIELHIQENLHRISVIEQFLSTSPDADDKECQKNISVLTKVNGLLQEIQKYRSIGTIKECREARNSRIKKKPITYTETNRADCPVCGAAVRGIGKPFGGFCAGCGQGIDWGGIE